jgi:hypothetical protein
MRLLYLSEADPCQLFDLQLLRIPNAKELKKYNGVIPERS